RRAYRRELNGQTLVVEGSRLLALDHGLTFRLDAIQDFRRNRRVDLLKVHGRGSVVFSVGGPVLAHEVSTAFPLSISSRDLVAWSGDLVPSVLDDDFLEEVMQPDIASPPKIRFEGEGVVLTEPPRPRRRVSDQDRPVDQRRN
ncbi:MAG TPA: AIM24 family protein, partial [Thermoanaerobaculia bacterium]